MPLSKKILAGITTGENTLQMIFHFLLCVSFIVSTYKVEYFYPVKCFIVDAHGLGLIFAFEILTESFKHYQAP